MGVYSKKVKSLDQIKQGARVGVPNDPTNGGRGLLLLQSQGPDQAPSGRGPEGHAARTSSENPKKIKIVELDAAPAAALARRPGRCRDQRQLRGIRRPVAHT